jgi:hypothetical protein
MSSVVGVPSSFAGVDETRGVFGMTTAEIGALRQDSDCRACATLGA